eukprot:PhM_4_TR13921/c1_g1_i2/m.100595
MGCGGSKTEPVTTYDIARAEQDRDEARARAQEMDVRLKKIEGILSEIRTVQTHQQQQQSAATTPRTDGPAAEFGTFTSVNPTMPPSSTEQHGGGLRRTSVGGHRASVSFSEVRTEVVKDDDTTAQPMAVGGSVRFASPDEDDKKEKKTGFMMPSPMSKDKDKSTATIDRKESSTKFALGSDADEKPKAAPTRKAPSTVRHARRQFFEKYFTPEEIVEQNPPEMKCGWLGCASLGLSFLLDAAEHKHIVTVDEIFATNQLALHYSNFTSVCLAELMDIVQEFIAVQKQCVESSMSAEMITFDLETVEAIDEDEEAVGDHGPIMSLSAFRKEISADMNSTDSVHIFNYDPFVVQEARARVEDEDEDEDDGFGAATQQQPRGSTRKWQKKNMGAFAVLLSFNSALHEVELATVYIGNETRVVLEKTSLQTLYNSCCVKDGYTKRPRGFIKVTHGGAARHVQPTMYPIRLLDGTSSKGQLSIALDPQISPHILAMGLATHLLKETILNTSSSTDRKNSRNATGAKDQLRGIAVTDICETLHLPIAVVVAGSNRLSLMQSFAFLTVYFSNKGLANDVHLGVVPITRKDGADDGAPSLSEEDFEAQVAKIKSGCGSIMVLNFDINVAQNVMGLEVKGEPSHFGVVSRYDPATKVVTLADVSVKKFKKQWSAPLRRIYTACIGFGYLLLSNKKTEVIDNGAPRYSQDILDNAKFLLPPRVSCKGMSMLEFPPKVYCTTLLAYALHLMGEDVTVEDIAYGSGFHLSFLLSDHLALQDVVRIVRRFVSTRVDNDIHVSATNFDKRADGTRTVSIEDFRKNVTDNLSSSRSSTRPEVLIFNFAALMIQSKSTVWNGSHGGSYAILTDYDAANDTIIVTDANPEQYFRVWKVPLEVMYEACCGMDPISDRAKGCLVLRRGEVGSVKAAVGRTLGIDLRNCHLHHPFKPPLSSRITAIAAAISELCEVVSPEEVLYSFYTSDGGNIDEHFALCQLNSQLSMT